MKQSACRQAEIGGRVRVAWPMPPCHLHPCSAAHAPAVAAKPNAARVPALRVAPPLLCRLLRRRQSCSGVRGAASPCCAHGCKDRDEAANSIICRISRHASIVCAAASCSTPTLHPLHSTAKTSRPPSALAVWPTPSAGLTAAGRAVQRCRHVVVALLVVITTRRSVRQVLPQLRHLPSKSRVREDKTDDGSVQRWTVGQRHHGSPACICKRV